MFSTRFECSLLIFSTRFEYILLIFSTRFECNLLIFSTRFEYILLIFSTRFECSFQLFNYRGSSTTPPCREDVDWWVSSRPIPVPYEQMDALVLMSKPCMKYDCKFP